MTDTSFRNYRYSTGGGCENCITLEGFDSSQLGKYGAKCPECEKKLERCGDCGRFYHIRTFVTIKRKNGWTTKCYNCGKDDPNRIAPITIDFSPYMGTISSDPEPDSIESKTVQTSLIRWPLIAPSVYGLFIRDGSEAWCIEKEHGGRD